MKIDHTTFTRMNFKRTKSCPSKALLCSNPQSRKRKASKLAAKFELVRPTAPAPPTSRRKVTNDIPVTTIHEHEEHKCQPDRSTTATITTTTPNITTKPNLKPSLSSASISLPSMKLQTKSETQSQKSRVTPQSLKSLENQNQAFSVQRLSHINPLSFTQSCLRAYKIREELYQPPHQLNDFFLEVSEEHLAAYQADLISAIRNGDIETLRSIKKSGRSLQGSNRFGESIMHIACRRGAPDTVSFLMNEGGCTLRVVDDYGRTPLHDACWQTEPDFKLIEIILDAEPSLLLHKDKRGHTCLEYARRENWGIWIQYLSHRMKKEIRRQLNVQKGQSE